MKGNMESKQGKKKEREKKREMEKGKIDKGKKGKWEKDNGKREKGKKKKTKKGRREGGEGQRRGGKAEAGERWSAGKTEGVGGKQTLQETGERERPPGGGESKNLEKLTSGKGYLGRGKAET